MNTEEWEWEEGTLYEDGKPIVTAGAFCDQARAMKLRAARDMARALWAVADLANRASALRTMLGEERMDAIRTALKKAGVPL